MPSLQLHVLLSITVLLSISLGLPSDICICIMPLTTEGPKSPKARKLLKSLYQTTLATVRIAEYPFALNLYNRQNTTEHDRTRRKPSIPVVWKAARHGPRQISRTP